MCGIVGVANIGAAPQGELKRQILSKMLASLVNRGPDGQGVFADESVGLGHARLAIIDLDGGQQPIHNEDKSIWVVFNGEIFNYLELRNDLERRGHVFYTHTDTEVLVHLYEEYDLAFVDHLNGQFAFSIWDARAQRLVLVRDRTGILPLFYAEVGQRLLFASSIKSILAVLPHTPQINLAALDQLFTFWSPVADATMFAGIKQLLPGCILVLQNGELCLSQYWDWRFAERGGYHPGDQRELALQLRSLLLDATRLRLRADVPVGSYLSGGLDSTALVGLMCEAGVRPDTFSLAFNDPGLDESEYQRQAARHFSVRHQIATVNDESIRNGFVRAVFNAEVPFLRCAPIPMMNLSASVRAQHYKVVLTGEGADEVFGGYDLFKEAKLRRFWARQPASKWRPLLLQRLYPYLNLTSKRTQAYSEAFFGAGIQDDGNKFFAHMPRWHTTAQCKVFFSIATQASLKTDSVAAFAATLPEEFGRWDAFNQAQYVEAKSLLANYLLCTQGDRMLMANSVEGRFPYLDHRVIEFAAKLDPRMKMRVLNEKFVLKQAVKNLLPAGILARKKQPYRAPDSRAFAGETTRFMARTMSRHAVGRAGYFDVERVNLLLKKVQAGRAVSQRDNMAFIGVLSTQVWHQLFVERCPETLAAASSGA